MSRVLFLIAGVFLCAGLARADEVILKDGSVLRGEVLRSKTPGQLALATQKQGKRVVVEIPLNRVRRVRRLSASQERQLRTAEEAILAGELPRAILILRAFVKELPQDGQGHRELGFALLLANQPEQALPALEQACKLDPHDLEAHLSLARLLEGRRELDRAITAYQHATRLGPRHLIGWLALGRLLLERGGKGDRQRALGALEKASRLDPRNEGVVLERAAALMAGGSKTERALAVDILRALLRKVPGALLAGRFLAQVDAADGRTKLALARIAGLLRRKDLPPQLRERLEAEAALYGWLDSGARAPAPPTMNASAATLDLTRARLRLLMLLELLPLDGRLQLALARIELRAGEHGQARTWLKRAARSGPREVTADANLLLEVTAILLRADLVPGATPPQTWFGQGVPLARARRLVAVAPWAIPAQRTLGRALTRDGEFAAAAKAYAAAIPWARSGAVRAELEAAAAEAREQADRKRRNKNL